MSYKAIFLTLISVAILFTSNSLAAQSKTAAAQSKTTNDTSNYSHLLLTAQAAQGRADYHNAESLYTAAAKIAEGFPVNDNRLTITLENLASCYKAEGNFIAEGPVRKKIISLYLKQFSNEYPPVAQTWVNAALAYRAQGDYLQAQLYYAEALICYESSVGPKNIRVAEILGDLGQLYMIEGDFIKAENLYKRALAISVNYPSDEKLYTALQDELASTLEHQGKWVEAQRLLVSAL